MSVTAIVGILIAACGMYLSLVERSSVQDSATEERPAGNETPARFTVPGSTVYHTAIFVGLAILGISQLSVPESLSQSVLRDGMRGTVFCLGACLTLAGAVGVIFSSTARSVVLSAAILGTGGATVLGVSGNAILGGTLLAGAAFCGWWLHSTSQRENAPAEQQRNKQHSLHSPLEEAFSSDSKQAAEPLLTSIAIVLFCWVLTSTIQSAIQEGSGSANTMSGSSRALPRPAFSSTTTSAPGQDTNEDSSAEIEPSSRETALFWCAAGLLAATVVLGYSQSDGERTKT